MVLLFANAFGSRSRRAKDEPRCEELRAENTALTANMFRTKDVQISVVQTVEFLKSEKGDLLKRKVMLVPASLRSTHVMNLDQENLNNELSMVSDTIQRSRSRIVQSPERIKRTIATMGSTVVEEKRTVAIHDAKARDLQIKISGVLNMERVSKLIPSFALAMISIIRTYVAVWSSCKPSKRRPSHFSSLRRNWQASKTSLMTRKLNVASCIHTSKLVFF